MTGPDQPDDSVPTVECEPHSVEDTGEASSDKLDQLIAIAANVKTALNRRTTAFGIILIALGLLWYNDNGQTSELKTIAETNRENGQIARQNSEILLNATGPEARARSAATLAGAINELQRVGICAALYATDEFHPACQDITSVMDRVVAGEDPFAR